MLFVTLIHRLDDGLPLCASTNVNVIPNQESWRRYQQEVVRSISTQRDVPRKMTVDQGQYSHHILTVNGVIYSTLCQKGDNLAASYAFLEEIANEFQTLYADQIHDERARPYMFIKFDYFISKSSKVYQSPQGARAAPADVTRRTYNQVMGIAEKESDSDNTALYVFGGISVVALILVLTLLYFLMG